MKNQIKFHFFVSWYGSYFSTFVFSASYKSDAAVFRAVCLD